MFEQYSPYGYTMPQFNQFSQFGQPTQNLPQRPQQSGPDWMQVPTVKQVEQIQVQPGGKAWVMVQNEPVFALRVADQMGLVTTSYYRFEKYDPDATAATSSPEYVTRAEFEKFVQSLSAPKQPAARAASNSAKEEK